MRNQTSPVILVIDGKPFTSQELLGALFQLLFGPDSARVRGQLCEQQLVWK